MYFLKQNLPLKYIKALKFQSLTKFDKFTLANDF